jgi:predicted phage terminase large subunit-like protein
VDIKSVLAGGKHRADWVAAKAYPELIERFPAKAWWFLSKGYQAHAYQLAMHGAADENGHLTRFRHLVAGRRGGKTLSAAWEVLFYLLHPAQFHMDAHGLEKDRPLWVWVLAKDYPTGFASLMTLLDVMNQAGLVKGKDYQYNKTERRIEFSSGSVVQFKTADDPQSLRGAGLDILWIDEAAFIDAPDAWHVVRPALSDKLGIVITTTTPHGKNWLWEEFFTGPSLKDKAQFRVQYVSIDCTHFPRSEWDYAREHYHPIFFKQEYMASFDAFAGIALPGDWLHYWVAGNAEPQTSDISIKSLLRPDGSYDLRIFIGIDPAISLSDTADSFAMCVLGVTDDNEQVFVMDTFKGRVAFPDQLDLIRTWVLKWRPELIGIEANAFQRAIVQQSVRLEGFPGIVPVFSRGKKQERIMSMSPMFKHGKVRIHKRHADFLDEWVAFDPEKKNGRDDLLDATEIALGVAGVLLAIRPHESLIEEPRPEHPSDVARAQLRAIRDGANRPYDPDLGSEA